MPNNATYAASKAFANTFSESLRGELHDSGIHVTLLAPGPVRTERWAGLVKAMARDMNSS